MQTVEINSLNYYSQQIDTYFMSASQFKSFRDCEARTFAKLKGEWQEEPSKAMLVGSYVDSYFTQDLEIFKDEHPEIFLRDGETLRAEFRNAEDMIARAERDDLFMQYLEGDKQKILTGWIEGVPFKCMMDVLNIEKGRIVDLKTTRDFKGMYNQDVLTYTGFIESWRYDIQGAVYRELVRQATGKTLDFFIAAITRESQPDIGLFEVPKDALDDALLEIESLAGHFSAIKEGYEKPQRCEHCDYCKATRVLSEPVDYREYDWR